MQINPDKPYHTRSPDYEAEIWKIDGNYIYGRWREKRKVGVNIWATGTWELDGHFIIGKKNINDLIQEPEEEVIVWEDVVEIVVYFDNGRTLSKGFDKPIKITIQDDNGEHHDKTAG